MTKLRTSLLGLVCLAGRVYDWWLELQRKLYTQGVIFKKLKGLLPLLGRVLSVCMETDSSFFQFSCFVFVVFRFLFLFFVFMFSRCP